MARAAKVVCWREVLPGRTVLYKGELRKVIRVDPHAASALLVTFDMPRVRIGVVSPDALVAVVLTAAEKARLVDRIRGLFRGE